MDDRPGFGLYVHWPFCQAKCPYCDFNSHVVSQVDQTRWAGAFVSEIRRVAEVTKDRLLDSVFFGGGTPSLMHPKTVDAVLDAVRGSWTTANDLEVTLEANPSSVEAARFEAYRASGVNRVSLGVQALNDRDLKALGRLHSVLDARNAFETACKVFDRVSFDLIYARQNQSLSDWEAELREALEIADGHVSLYQLTIEDNTAFGERFARGRLGGLPDEDLSADMYSLTQDMTEAFGLPAYEISNHARPGEESKHNLIYWRSGDWAAVGPGAHGRLTLDGYRCATTAHSQPGKWLKLVEDIGSGENSNEMLSQNEVKEERLMMGLRLTDGIPESAIDQDQLLINKINNLRDMGLMKFDTGRFAITEKGRPLLNAILREILT